QNDNAHVVTVAYTPQTPLVDIAAPGETTDTAATTATASADKQAPANNKPGWIQIHIRRGDTLSLAFARHDLSYRDSLALAHLDKHGSQFTRGLRAGDTM